MTEEGGQNKREDRLSGPSKRLFSPPEESHSAKRVRSSPPELVTNSAEVSLKEEGPPGDPVRTPRLNGDRSDGRSGSSVGESTTADLAKGKSSAISLQSVSDRLVGEQRKHQEKGENAQSDFTAITELKAAETKTSRNLQSCLDEDVSTVTACAQTATREPEQEEVLEAKASTRTLETDGDAVNGTSSAQDQTTGTPCRLKYTL